MDSENIKLYRIIHVLTKKKVQKNMEIFSLRLEESTPKECAWKDKVAWE